MTAVRHNQQPGLWHCGGNMFPMLTDNIVIMIAIRSFLPLQQPVA
ncbi:hypothetical protein EPYR_01527 [Erwinia pyrifoliae DSM 12163]|nr:hypothetical protein EPYR_01527 [Erwinia pyrifoliae DSM 12163]